LIKKTKHQTQNTSSWDVILQSFFFVLAVLGGWTESLQVLYHFSHFACQTFLLSVIFDRILLYAQVQLRPRSSCLYFPCSRDDRCASLGPATGWDGDFTNFLPVLASNRNPPNLCFPSSRITGLSHHIQLKVSLINSYLRNNGTFWKELGAILWRNWYWITITFSKISYLEDSTLYEIVLTVWTGPPTYIYKFPV
jgi:hypothetical protein